MLQRMCRLALTPGQRGEPFSLSPASLREPGEAAENRAEPGSERFPKSDLVYLQTRPHQTPKSKLAAIEGGHLIKIDGSDVAAVEKRGASARKAEKHLPLGVGRRVRDRRRIWRACAPRC